MNGRVLKISAGMKISTGMAIQGSVCFMRHLAEADPRLRAQHPITDSVMLSMHVVQIFQPSSPGVFRPWSGGQVQPMVNWPEANLWSPKNL